MPSPSATGEGMRPALPASGTAILVAVLAACGNSFSAGGGADASTGPTDGGVTDSTATGEGGDDGASTPEGAAEASGPESGTPEASSVEGGSEGGDGGSGDAGVPCGQGLACSGTTPVCCLPSGGGPSCAHQECGCNTQLACASDLDCQIPLGLCCIGDVKDSTCGQGHFAAACAAACLGSESHLCDPSSPTT
jgi:hypothetical protein